MSAIPANSVPTSLAAVFFAAHVYSLGEANNVVVTIRHIGDPFATPAGTVTRLPANFRVDVRNRDASTLFSMDDTVAFGGSKDILLSAPGDVNFQGSIVVDAPIKDGLSLAPFLTWNLDVSEQLEPLRIGAFFSWPQDAARLHYFPGEANETTGLGIAVQNIGENEITCTLDFVDEEGNAAGQEIIEPNPLGSFVGFFDNSVPADFKGGASLVMPLSLRWPSLGIFAGWVTDPVKSLLTRPTAAEEGDAAAT